MLLLPPRGRCCCVVSHSQDAKAFTKSNQNVILVFATHTVGGFPRGITTVYILYYYSMKMKMSSPSLLKARARIAQMSEKLKTDSISVSSMF